MDWEDSIDVYKAEYTANQQTQLEAISELFTWMKQKNKVAKKKAFVFCICSTHVLGGDIFLDRNNASKPHFRRL